MKKKIFLIVPIVLYFAFLIIAFLFSNPVGMKIGKNFFHYAKDMVKILPFAFILIGLFEIWVKRETVEKHLGKGGGILSYLWVILLGGTTIGPMIVALPIAYSIANKGARMSVVFTYIGAAAVCRIPMTIFEASYLGIPFTIIRYSVSIPLIILSSIFFGSYLERIGFDIRDSE